MLEGIFVTVTGFRNYQNKLPFVIGAQLLCCKDPENTYDSESIRVFAKGGKQVGHIANSTAHKANGTMSAARIYDRVGDCFIIEVCFTTQTKIICKVIHSSLTDPEALQEYTPPKTLDQVYADNEADQ